jgi:pantoate--beta-alanine ligase
MTTILSTVAELRTHIASWRKRGERIALTPTMGALHEGHVSLVALGKAHAECVVATIFVNPTQFAANEDFGRYPRPFEADLEKLRSAGADALFAPDVAEMYPKGDATRVLVEGPANAGLDDLFRPTHFTGVATVVCKLLLQALPDVAIFGEKDWQQLAVIRQMVRDLMIPVEILGAPTMRASDGLALSSRNQYLSTEERALAPAIYAILQAIAADLRQGLPPESAESSAIRKLAAKGFAVDYVAIRDAQTLGRVESGFKTPLRILAAAKLGKTRLIDNIGLEPVAGA